MAAVKIGFSGTPNSHGGVAGIGFLTTAVASGSLVAPSSGTCNRGYIYHGGTGNTIGYFFVYDESGNLVASTAFNLSGAAGWYQVDVTAFDIVSGQTYYPGGIWGVGSADCYYDTTSGNGCDRETYSTPPATWSPTQNRTYAPGAHLEYDEATGGSIVPILVSHLQEQGAL